MAEQAEVPEAKDPFERRVAVTIAILAVALSVIGNKGDDAKTEAVLSAIRSTQKTTEAANNWAWFQSKSIKEHEYELHKNMLEGLSDPAMNPETREKLSKKYEAKLLEYRGDGEDSKKVIMAKAKALDEAAKVELAEATHLTQINGRCDQASLVLQIAIVICSLAILAHLNLFWIVGILLGVAGTAIGITSWFV